MSLVSFARGCRNSTFKKTKVTVMTTWQYRHTQIRYIRFVPKMGQIGPKIGQIFPKLDKTGTFSKQISAHNRSVNQNLLKSDRKSPRIVPFGPI